MVCFGLPHVLVFHPPYMHNRKLRDRLRRYKGRTLIIWGSDDRLVPREHAVAYAEGLGNSSIEIIENCGHSIQVEAAAKTATLIKNFIS